MIPKHIPDSRAELIEKAKMIEKAVDTTHAARVKSTSAEDCDGLYQADIEFNQWIDQQTADYKEIGIALGYPNKALFPISARKTHEPKN